VAETNATTHCNDPWRDGQADRAPIPVVTGLDVAYFVDVP